MHEFKNNEYIQTMKPTLYMMKIMCAMPIYWRSQNGIPNFLSSKIVSSASIVACLMYHKRYGIDTIDLLIDVKNLNIITLVAKGPDIIFEFFSLAVPLIMLNRNEQMQNYWKKWEILQLKYENITGTPYISRKRRYIAIATLVCISWLAMRTCYAALFHYYIFDDVFDFIATAYSHTLIHTILTYWLANCAYIRSTAEDILILGKKIIAEKKEHWKLNRLVAIWSNLNDLTNCFNDAHSFLFLIIFLMNITIIVAFSHTLLHYSEYEGWFPFSHFSNILLIFASFLLMLSETSHSVYYQMCQRQKEALLQENTMKMEIPVLQSVMRFLQTIYSQNSAISFNGFFNLTRMEFPVIMAICLNYLIVLRQFYEV